MVPVEGGQNLILAVAVQTVGRAIWNIQATMVECEHVIQEWADAETCGSPHPGSGNSVTATARQNLTVLGHAGVVRLTTSGVQLVVKSGYPILQGMKEKNLTRRNLQTSPERCKKKRTRKNKNKIRRKRKYMPIPGAEHPWVVRIMSGDHVECMGTVVDPHYVLTSADCLANRTGLYILSSTFPLDQQVSLYKVYTHHQYITRHVALIQTLTALHNSCICMARRVTSYVGVSGIMVGYKRNSKREDSMFYSDVTINEDADEDDPEEDSETVLEHSDLKKWVEGSPLLVKDAGREILLGFVTHRLSDSCSKLSSLMKLSSAVRGWITAVITQASPVMSVQ